MSHPIESIISSTMENLKNIIRVDTVVGDPIRLENDTLVLPVSRVSLGFVSGGGEYPVSGKSIANCKSSLEGGETRLPFAGTTAAGLTVTPVSFLAVHTSEITMFPAQYCGCGIERIIDALPQMLCACREIVREMKKRPAEAE